MTKNIPLSLGYPIFGHLFSYQENRLQLLEQHKNKFGKSFKIKLGPKIITVITHPEDVERVLLSNMSNYIKKTNFEMIFRQGLFTANGESWKAQRMSVQSLFSPIYLEKCAEEIVTTSETYFKSFSHKSDELVDVNEIFSKLTFGLIVKLIVGHDYTDNFKQLHQDLNYCANYLTYDSYNPFPWSSLLSPYSKGEFELSLKRIDKTVYESLEEQEDPQKRKKYSIVSKMIEAQSLGKISKVDHDLMRDNIVGLMFAGYETTALTLSWLSWILAKHQDVQEKLYLELSNLKSFDHESLSALTYTESVINETMRLYPAGWAFTRVALKKDELKDVSINPGDIVFLSPYLNQRDSEFWKNPNEFDPSRFLDKERMKSLPKFSFFPFGGGGRLCVGKALGILEMKIVLKFFLMNFKVEPSGVDPIPNPLATFQSKNGFKLILRKRI